MSPRLLEMYTDGRLCPHFHMSIQSANSKVLTDMKRNYSHKEVEWALKAIADSVPGAFVGMDVIVGFPGETAGEFENTYQRLADLPWTRVHVFPYSPRPGTYATRMDGHLRREEILKRSAQLRELSSQRYNQEARKQIGKEKKILILGSGKQGLSRDYWSVALSDSLQSRSTGTEVSVKVIGYDDSTSLSKMSSRLLGHLI